MSPATRRAGACVTVLTMVACVVSAVAIPIAHDALLGLAPPDLGASVGFSLVGAFLLLRGAVANIAVIMCVQGVGASLTTVLGVVAQLGSSYGPLRGGDLWAAWLNNFVWLPGVALLTPLVLLFPNGRLASRRWRVPIVGVGASAFAFAFISATARTGLVDGKPYSYAPSPTGFIRFGSALDAFGTGVFLAMIACLFVSLGSLVGRRRRAAGVERTQLTSLLFGATLTAMMIASLNLLPQSAERWVFVFALFSVAPVAVSIAVAVLRYRLFEIDKVVSRTVTYVLVLAVLAGVYVGVVAALANLVPADYGQVGVAGATLVVSILAVPLTRRVRYVVDRRFNRSRFDAERVATAFAARLRARPERGDVPTDLLDVVRRTVAPTHARVWLVNSGDAT